MTSPTFLLCRDRFYGEVWSRVSVSVSVNESDSGNSVQGIESVLDYTDCRNPTPTFGLMGLFRVCLYVSYTFEVCLLLEGVRLN